MTTITNKKHVLYKNLVPGQAFMSNGALFIKKSGDDGGCFSVKTGNDCSIKPSCVVSLVNLNNTLEGINNSRRFYKLVEDGHKFVYNGHLYVKSYACGAIRIEDGIRIDFLPMEMVEIVDIEVIIK